MFETVFVMPAQRSQAIHQTVIEKRAPTDESVKIFSELVEAAKSEVVASIKVSDTAFSCVVHAAHDMASGDTVLAAVFSLAGRKERVESRTPLAATPQEKYEQLVADVARRIAEIAVAPALTILLQQGGALL